MTMPATRGRSLRVPASIDQLAALRAFVRDAALEFGASRDATDDLVQAVDEAASNIVIHGYQGVPGEIQAAVDLKDRQIEVTLFDRCPDYDPTAAPAPDLSVHPMGRKPGGMGVHLMRLGTGAVHHRRRPGGGNELTLVQALDESRAEG